MNAIGKAEGVWIEDLAGRRYMDFHGSNVHYLGYAHPHVIASIKAQLDELSLRRAALPNEVAVQLAEALGTHFKTLDVAADFAFGHHTHEKNPVQRVPRWPRSR